MRDAADGKCGRCGYDRRATPGLAPCPECGERPPVPPARVLGQVAGLLALGAAALGSLFLAISLPLLLPLPLLLAGVVLVVGGRRLTQIRRQTRPAQQRDPTLWAMVGGFVVLCFFALAAFVLFLAAVL